MRMLFLLNDVRELKREQTTALLMRAAFKRGRQVFATGVNDLFLATDDRVKAHARVVEREAGDEDLPGSWIGDFHQPLVLDDCDVVLIRTSPGRDTKNAAAHRMALALMRLLRDRGVQVYNDPVGLQRASSKLYLVHLPREFRPQTLISRRPEDLDAFAASLDGPCVFKPLVGSQGRDVFLMRPESRSNHDQIIDVLCRQGYVVAQEYMQEATAGDVRVLLMDGEPLEAEGKVAAVRRIPGPNSFRSNIHSGGHAEATPISDEQRRAVQAIGPILKEDGIRLSGLDFIGNRVVEVNVFSAGGLVDAERFYDAPFCAQVLERMERPPQ